jgi:hypothetical protein
MEPPLPMAAPRFAFFSKGGRHQPQPESPQSSRETVHFFSSKIKAVVIIPSNMRVDSLGRTRASGKFKQTGSEAIMRKALVVAVLLVTTTCFADSFDIRGTLTSPFSGKTVTTLLERLKSTPGPDQSSVGS